MKKVISLFFLFISFLSISCKKEYSFEGKPQETGDYFPLTTNSNWTYSYETPFGYIPGPVTITNSGVEAAFNSNVYKTFINQHPTGTEYPVYYRRSGNDYFEYFGESIEFPFLKTNVPVNTTWIVEYNNGNSYKIKREYILQGKLQTFTVGNLSFKDVLKVSCKVMIAENNAPFTETVEEERYFAKDIGLVKSISKVGPAPSGDIVIMNLSNYKVF